MYTQHRLLLPIKTNKKLATAPSVGSAAYTEKLNMYLFCALKLEKLSKHLHSFFDNVPIERIWFRLVELSYLDQLFQYQQSAFSLSCRLSFNFQKKNSKVEVEDTEFSLVRKSVTKSQSFHEKDWISSEGKMAFSVTHIYCMFYFMKI